jgi:methylisocitrate lyase
VHQSIVSLFQTGKPLQIIGVPNALFAKMAEEVGFQALYLSGASLSANAFAYPDLGLLSLETLLDEAARLVGATTLPLLVDIDNGWDHPLLLEVAQEEFSRLGGVAALQIEDQAGVKRCGHREGIQLVSPEEMCERISILKKGSFEVVARTDAFQQEGIEKTIQRCHLYGEAGADLFFVEAVPSLEVVHQLKRALKKPLLLNLTEFGKTPTFSKEEMAKAGVEALLYPLTLSRVLWGEGKRFLEQFQKESSQKFVLEKMMNREELYQLLDYERFEKIVDRITP